MKNLNCIAPPYIGYFQDIVDAKNDTYKGRTNVTKSTLVGLKEQVELKYNHYQSKYDASLLHELDDSYYVGDEKAALLKAYSDKGHNLNLLKKAIKDAQELDLKNICPYCGILTPNSIDHYIPKDTYPEYSVLAINLVPCCIQCNGKKSEFWKLDTGRGIINYYLDSIPNEEYLSCSVKFEEKIPRAIYSISNDNGINSALFSIIETHYERLDLLNRFSESSNDEITNTLDSIHSFTENSSQKEIKSMLNDSHSRKTLRYGVNHWKCALLKGLAQSQVFCGMAVNGI